MYVNICVYIYMYIYIIHMCVHVRICHNGRMEWNPLIICACPSTIINLSLLCIRHLSQIHSNPPPNEYFCCHIDPHCERDCGRCVEYHLNVQTDDLVQSFSWWVFGQHAHAILIDYAGLLGAFTKHHHTVYSNFHPLSGDAFLFTTDARQAFDHFPIRVDTSASFADHICVGTISIYQILDQHIFNSHQFTSFK